MLRSTSLRYINSSGIDMLCPHPSGRVEARFAMRTVTKVAQAKILRGFPRRSSLRGFGYNVQFRDRGVLYLASRIHAFDRELDPIGFAGPILRQWYRLGSPGIF